VMRQGRMRRPEPQRRAQDLGRWCERGRDHPREWQQHDDRRGQENGMERQAAGGSAGRGHAQRSSLNTRMWTRVRTRTVARSMAASADAYPTLKYRKPFSHMSYTSVRTSLAAAPWISLVIMKTGVNTLNALMDEMTTTKRSMGRSRGSVMLRKTFHPEAPSTAAAS